MRTAGGQTYDKRRHGKALHTESGRIVGRHRLQMQMVVNRMRSSIYVGMRLANLLMNAFWCRSTTTRRTNDSYERIL